MDLDRFNDEAFRYFDRRFCSEADYPEIESECDCCGMPLRLGESQICRSCLNKQEG